MAGFDLFGAMMNPGTSEVAPGLSDIQMKRQILAALLAQSTAQQPTQMAGQIAIPQGPAAALARALTGGMAMHRLSGLSQQELELARQQQERSTQAGAELGGVVAGTRGTGGMMQEQPGPPNPDTGEIPMASYPGTPGRGPTPEEFNAAYERARYAGVDPKVLADALSQHTRNRNLAGVNDASVQAMLPWNQGGGGAPQFTPATPTRGASMTLPAGAPSGGASPGGGGMYGVPGSAAGFIMSGDQALEKLGALIGKYAEPANLREGGSLTKLDAQGNPVIAITAPKLPEGTRMVNGQIEPIPGYMGTKADILTKEAAIKAGFSPVTLQTENGTPIQGYLTPGGVFKQFTTGGAAQPQSAPGIVPQGTPANGQPGAGFPGVPKGQGYTGRAAPNDRGAILQGELADNQAKLQASPGDVQARRNVAAIQEEIARLPGRAGVTTAIGGGAPGGAIGVGQSPAAAEFSKSQGADLAKQFQGYSDTADQATQGRAVVKQMLDATKGFEPGVSAPIRQKLGEWALQMGMDEGKVTKLVGGDLAAMEEMDKLAFNNSISQLRSTLGPSQQIRQLEMLENFKRSPTASLRRAALQTILEMQDGTYAWQLDRHDQSLAWQQAGKDPRGFSGWCNRNHPLTGVDNHGKSYIPTLDEVKARIAAVKPATGAGTRQTSGGIGGAGNSVPPDIAALLQKYGGQ